MAPDAPDIPGAADVVAWFSNWPTFHDAEVLSISLNRSGESRIAIHAHEMTPEVDAEGHYVTAKHAILTFHLEGFPRNEFEVTSTRIEAFNHQNVLSSATVNRNAGGYELVLEGCYGVEGVLACERMSVTLEPGIPPGSVYLKPTRA